GRAVLRGGRGDPVGVRGAGVFHARRDGLGRGERGGGAGVRRAFPSVAVFGRLQRVRPRERRQGMSSTVAPVSEPQVKQGFPRPFKRPTTVYAIAFDMDIDALRANYGDPYNNAYQEIRRVLARHGFTWQQGSVYFGGDTVTAVTCVLAAQDLA